MISERDFPILRAFLEREAHMYMYKPETAFDHRSEFIQNMFHQIVDNVSSGYNYVHIQSITNMGLVDSELVLSGHPWDSSRDIYCSLPPSPRGTISFIEKQHGKG